MTNASKTKLQTKAKLALALVLAASIVTACTSDDGAGKENIPSAVNNGSGTNTTGNNNEGPSAIMDPDSAVPDEDEEMPGDSGSETQEDNAVVTAKGTFNGQIDSHSIELNTAEGTAAFQHGDELNDAVSKLQKDDQVNYTYMEKQFESDGRAFTQLWLVSIEKAS